MLDIIFKMQKGFDDSPNTLLPIDSNYNFMGSCCAFGNLSKSNIFIGENNSGKSRFLRSLFAKDFYGIDIINFKKFFSDIKGSVYQSYSIIPETDIGKFNGIYEKIGNEYQRYSNVGNTFFTKLKPFSKLFSKANKYYFPVIRGSKDYKTIINNKLTNFLSQQIGAIQNQDSINHFISLLNLETKGLESFDIYNDIIVYEYFKNNKDLDKNIFTGGKLYQEIKSMLLGEEAQRKTVEEFQKFLQAEFFNEYDKVQLIPNEKEKSLYVKIGKDERAIYDWGDGTQQLIIILFSLFKHKDEKDKLFFIEEPEMYLHPGILRKFIEVINSDVFPNHHYFITTHSNVVLDTSADTDVKMSIFKFRKINDVEKNDGKNFVVEQCSNGDISLLNELGVRNSSLFLSNCSIWVEGITDRLYLKHFLKLYKDKNKDKKEFRENIDYTFIEYGGGNITHFNFGDIDNPNSINAKYINNKIFVIADNDNTKEGTQKYKRKELLKQQLGEHFYELRAREVENLITFDTLKKILITQNNKQEQTINQIMSKKTDLTCKSLGTYIDGMFPNGEIKKYAAESGTVKNKLEFCKTATYVLNDFDDLSDEAKELTEKIYAFIEKNNEF